MKTVKLLDTSGKNETSAIVLLTSVDTNTNTITKESKQKESYATEYYAKNRERLLGHKRKWASDPKNKPHIVQYHKDYYLRKKEEKERRLGHE